MSLPIEKIRITRCCNLACPFCRTCDPKAKSHEPPQKIYDLIEKYAAKGVGTLVFEGGEPLLCPKLESYINRAAKLGIKDLRLKTNAQLLNRDTAKKLVALGITEFIVTLSQYREIDYEVYTGHTGNFELLQRNLKALERNSFNFSLHIYLTRVSILIFEYSITMLMAHFPTAHKFTFEVVQLPRTKHANMFGLFGYPIVKDKIIQVSDYNKIGYQFRLAREGYFPPCFLTKRDEGSAELYFEILQSKAERPNDVFGEKCRACALREYCSWNVPEYVDSFGDEGAVPYERAEDFHWLFFPNGKEFAPDSLVDANKPPHQLTSGELRIRDRKVVSLRCLRPWTTIEIGDEGKVYTCCSDWTRVECGNIHKQSLLDIWNGEAFRRLRKKLRAGHLEDICHRECLSLMTNQPLRDIFRPGPQSASFARNQSNVWQAIEHGQTQMDALPLFLTVCVTLRCNFDCRMCYQEHDNPHSDLPDDFFRELYKILPYLRVLTFTGGEPFLSQGCVDFLKKLDGRRYPDLLISMVTNGSLLTKSFLKQFKRTPFGRFTISLNAATPETYKLMNCGVTWNKIMKNIQALKMYFLERCQQASLRLSFCIARSNYHEMLEFVKLCRTLEADFRFLPINYNRNEESFFTESELVNKVLEETVRVEEFLNSDSGEALAHVQDLRRMLEHRIKTDDFSIPGERGPK